MRYVFLCLNSKIQTVSTEGKDVLWMTKTEGVQDSLYIFGSLFMLSNKMGTLLDRDLEEFGVTSKQWYLSLLITMFFETPPTLKEAAQIMGTSYQNVKQIALKLEEKGLLRIEKDSHDARVLRLVTTEESQNFWEKTRPKGAQFMKDVFHNIDHDQLAQTRGVIQELLLNISEMEKRTLGKDRENNE